MSKIKLYIIGAAVIVLLLIGIFVGWKWAGMILGVGATEEYYRNQKKKAGQQQKEMKEEADKIEKDSEKRAEKAKKVVEEGKKRDKRTEKLNKDDKHRKQKADDLEKEVDDLDEELENNDDKLKNIFNILLILLLSFSIVFSGPVLAQNNEQFNPENFKKAETLKEANKMLDNLLEITLNYRNLAYDFREKYNEENKDKKEFKKLYEEEREDKLAYKNMYQEEKEDKLFFKKIYNEERQDNKELQNIIGNQKTINDMLQDMNEFLTNQSKGGFGIYGGIEYKPLKPLNSGIEAGVSYDF